MRGRTGGGNFERTEIESKEFIYAIYIANFKKYHLNSQKACKRQVSSPLMTSFVVFAIQFPDFLVISALFIIQNERKTTTWQLVQSSSG